MDSIILFSFLNKAAPNTGTAFEVSHPVFTGRLRYTLQCRYPPRYASKYSLFLLRANADTRLEAVGEILFTG